MKRAKNIATAVIQAVGMKDDGTEVVAVKVKTDCQCETCAHRNAILFMGVVMHIAEESGLDMQEILTHAQMINQPEQSVSIH